MEFLRVKGEKIWIGLISVLLLALSTKYSEHPAFLVAGVAIIVLGYMSERCALTLLFGSCLLPYVGGLTVTFGYIVIAAMAPYALVHIDKDVLRMPRAFVFLSLATVLVSMALYPFTKALNLLYLISAVLLAWEICCIIVRSRLTPSEVRSALTLALGITVVLPLISNIVLIFSSPFWFPAHTGFARLGRLTVSIFDELLVSGYLTALFATVLFSSDNRIRWRDGYLIVLIVCIFATGSRAALLIVGAALVFALFALPRARRWRGTKAKAAIILFIAVCGITAVTGLAGIEPKTIERLAEGGGFLAGRVDSVRWALPTLDRLPLMPIDPGEYVRGGPPLVPHFAPAAAAILFGIPLACLVISLAAIPIIDLIQGSRLSKDFSLAAAYGCLVTLILVTPHVVDRGTFSLLGTWFALSRLPSLGAKEVHIPV